MLIISAATRISESVNCVNKTGIAEITSDKLAEVYKKGSDKLFKFIAAKHKRFTSELQFYKVENVYSLEHMEYRVDELLQIIKGILSMRKYIDSLDEETENDELIQARMSLQPLSEKYFKVLDLFRNSQKEAMFKADTEEVKLPCEEDKVDDSQKQANNNVDEVDDPEMVTADLDKEKDHADLNQYSVPDVEDTAAMTPGSERFEAELSALSLDLRDKVMLKYVEKNSSTQAHWSTASAAKAFSASLRSRSELQFSEIVDDQCTRSASVNTLSRVRSGVIDTSARDDMRVSGSRSEPGIDIDYAVSEMTVLCEPVESSWKYRRKYGFNKVLSLEEDLTQLVQLVDNRVINDIKLLASEAKVKKEQKTLRQDVEGIVAL